MDRLTEALILLISLPLLPLMLLDHLADAPLGMGNGCAWCCTKARMKYVITGKKED